MKSPMGSEDRTPVSAAHRTYTSILYHTHSLKFFPLYSWGN